ncbi:Arm DNA-binding domain-containing protein [Duganella sp. CY15W]
MLTDTRLKNLKPQDRLYKIAGRGGLYIAVSPSGGVSFRFNYRAMADRRL